MDSMTTKHFEKLSIGMNVHYVHPNGTHSEASVLHVHNRETGVVDLFVRRNDHIQEHYKATTVAYRDTPIAYSWHLVEVEK
jgi:hypothetical protein